MQFSCTLNLMNASLLTLRRSPAKILHAIEARQEVTLTRRGKPIARIVPFGDASLSTVREQPAFGMWQDQSGEPVAEQVRKLRKGRSFDF